ncbi:MAG TPA: MoaD/ThiS family protein [Paenalcaligenes sp.]|nr:MoaD/ThiS family protein [Paenalcaligenes sp.]
MSQPTIKVLYFAQVAELLEKREESWPLAADLTVRQLIDELCHRYEQLEPLKGRLQVAINQNHAQAQDTISAQDEVAVFEPVTGG